MQSQESLKYYKNLQDNNREYKNIQEHTRYYKHIQARTLMLHDVTNLYYTISIKWVFGPLPPRASIKWVLCGKIRAGSPFYRGGLPRIWESVEALKTFDNV